MVQPSQPYITTGKTITFDYTDHLNTRKACLPGKPDYILLNNKVFISYKRTRVIQSFSILNYNKNEILTLISMKALQKSIKDLKQSISS